jgi:hypothetical protein
MMKSLGLYRWLNDCQLNPKHPYYHGWAESRNLLMELADKCVAFEFSVLATFSMDTPPPTSQIPMPVVKACSHQFSVVFVENWIMEPFYTVSVRRKPGERLLLHGFVELIGEDRPWLTRHLPARFVYGPVSEEAKEFVGAIANAHMLFAFFKLLESHEPAVMTPL